MLKRRTDLALEAAQLWQESAGEAGTLPGVESEEATREGYPVTTVRIRDEAGARALGKPVGTYVTLELDGLARREEDAFGRAARALAPASFRRSSISSSPLAVQSFSPRSPSCVSSGQITRTAL